MSMEQVSGHTCFCKMKLSCLNELRCSGKIRSEGIPRQILYQKFIEPAKAFDPNIHHDYHL